MNCNWRISLHSAFILAMHSIGLPDFIVKSEMIELYKTSSCFTVYLYTSTTLCAIFMSCYLARKWKINTVLIDSVAYIAKIDTFYCATWIKLMQV